MGLRRLSEWDWAYFLPLRYPQVRFLRSSPETGCYWREHAWIWAWCLGVGALASQSLVFTFLHSKRTAHTCFSRMECLSRLSSHSRNVPYGGIRLLSPISSSFVREYLASSSETTCLPSQLSVCITSVHPPCPHMQAVGFEPQAYHSLQKLTVEGHTCA